MSSNMIFWDILGFESNDHERQLRDICRQVGAKYQNSEVTPSFRYVVQATQGQISCIVDILPWIKHWYPSCVRNSECALVETPGDQVEKISNPGFFDDDIPSGDENITITADEARYISKTCLGKKISKAIRKQAKIPAGKLLYENYGQEKISKPLVDELCKKGFVVEEQRANEYFPEGGWWIKWGQ